MTDSPKRQVRLHFRSAAVLAATIALLHLGILIFGEGDISLLPIKDGFLILSSALAAAAMFYTAYHSAGRSRWAWIVFAAAILFNTIGELIWAALEVILRASPFLSGADVGYLIFYPLFALGIFLLPEEPFTSREKFKFLLDAAIVIISVTLVFWVLLIAPLIISTKVFDLEFAVSLAYILMDLLLFFALVELLFKKLDSREQGPILLLALSIAVMILSDTIFFIQVQEGTFVSGSLLDIGWSQAACSWVWQQSFRRTPLSWIDRRCRLLQRATGRAGPITFHFWGLVPYSCSLSGGRISSVLSTISSHRHIRSSHRPDVRSPEDDLRREQ